MRRDTGVKTMITELTKYEIIMFFIIGTLFSYIVGIK
jgi:hypothetical protein